MNIEVLQSIGFDHKQAAVYLTLLRLGPSPASKVSLDLAYDRVTTYYILMQMLEKGHVTQALKGRVKTFAATEPKQIEELLKERVRAFSDILPTLTKLKENQNTKIFVEVRLGKEGLHNLYREALLAGGELLGLGIDDSHYKEHDPIHFEQYNKEVERGKIKERLITTDNAKVHGSTKSEYRSVPKEYFNPTPIVIYGTKIGIVIWKPSITIISIESEELSDSFRKHFELLWKMAKKLPRQRRETH